MKKLILSFTLFLASFVASAQVTGVQGGLSYGTIFQLYSYGGIGVDFGLGFEVKDYKLIGNINYTIGGSYTDDYLYANASSSTTSPSSLEVQATSKFQTAHVEVGYLGYIRGDERDEFNIHWGVNAGILMGFYSIDPTESYDEANYNLDTYRGETMMDVTVGALIGMEKELSRDKFLYANARIFLPATDVMGSEQAIDLPGGVRLSVGMRFNMD